MTITKLGASRYQPTTSLDDKKKVDDKKQALTAGVQGSIGLTKSSETSKTTETSKKTSDIPADISPDLGSWTPKKISTSEDGNTVYELNSAKGLKITRISGGEMCDGGDTRWEVSSADGTKRDLTDEEKKALATNLDRNTSGHELDKKQDVLARDMLHELVQDPAVDTRWDAPNLLKDAAISEGKVTGRDKALGSVLGRQTGPLETLELANGNSAETKVYRESAPNGPGSTPIFSKTIASGEYEHIVKLSREEAIALRSNLKTQGPQFKDTVRDLDKYIRSLDPATSADTFERTSTKNPYQRYIG